jgi:RNA polymerase sigma-70 factor (ECF subfamily)
MPREKAIPKLLKLHGDRLYSLARRLCGNAADAEDLVQEIFLQAWRKWQQFQGRSSVTTWLYTIAARACRRMHRKRAGQGRSLSLDALSPFNEPRGAVLPEIGDGPATRQVREEAASRLMAALAELPTEFRLPVLFKDIFGLSLAETAEVLEVKEATVKTRLHRARLRLRKALTERLPRRKGPPPAYAKRVCMDLLQAKQDALDHGRRFPVGDSIVCERCRSVFASLDLTQDLCGRLADGRMPAPFLRSLLDKLRES